MDIWQKEWRKIVNIERRYVDKRVVKKRGVLLEQVEEKIPAKMKDTLEKGFTKALFLVLENGTGFIEKTYEKDEYLQNYQINVFADDLKATRKTAKTFEKNAKKSSRKNILLSGVKGAGFGLFGIGVPDIPIFVSFILKSLFEVSLHFGYDYEGEKERYFLLLVLYGAVSSGHSFGEINEEVNRFLKENQIPETYCEKERLQELGRELSSEVLCMKMVQGIPVVGVVGGVFDVVVLKKVLTYGKMKYQQRFIYDKLSCRKSDENAVHLFDAFD